MAEQYWISDFFIDLSRNQITKNNQSQTIAPKALAVLTCLAENQGKVVSQDALLAKVWQDTVVSPNTLQRSIAQLRKALGDDGKVQVYIKTHAKQGYSLECDVSWHDNLEWVKQHSGEPHLVNAPDMSQVDSEANTATNNLTNSADRPNMVLIAMTTILVIMIMALISYPYLAAKSPSPLSFGELRALTSTDNKEYASIYSPDGQYVVFHRYSAEFCVNNIWAKNTKTQEEIQLTKNVDSYGSHSFSKDGKNLVFIKTTGCSEPITQKKCYQLMSLDFYQALVSPQLSTIMMECKNSEIRNPKWLNNNNIALLQKVSDRWKLITYSINENKSQVLYALEEGNLIDYDYSVSDDLIALTSIHNDGHHYIEMLKSDGQLLSSHRISYPKEIAKFRYIYPNFSPLINQLIFSTGRQLFTLSYDGQVTNISFPLDQPISSPIFHPDGNQMLVIKGHYDSDIASVPLSKIARVQSKADKNVTVLERSILAEDSAILQPNGELIAYKSERSGEAQLWITDGKRPQKLSHFPIDTYLYGMVWAADGKSILVNANNTLTQIFLDSTQKPLPMEHPVVQLFQWDSINNSALLLLRIKGVIKFAELNLTNLETRIINDKTISWALKSEHGQLVYTDHMGRFWRPGPAEDQLIEALEGQGSEKQRFLIVDNVIYGINDTYQLWSYTLNEEIFEIIGELPSNVDYLTDINQTQLLLTVRVTAKKEVAELYLRD